MKKQLCCGLLVFLLIFMCSCSNYRKANILGKTARQITEQYGSFSLVDECFISVDSSHSGLGCAYSVRPSRKGFLDKVPEVFFVIEFDENGTAVNCYQGYHSNGG